MATQISIVLLIFLLFFGQNVSGGQNCFGFPVVNYEDTFFKFYWVLYGRSLKNPLTAQTSLQKKSIFLLVLETNLIKKSFTLKLHSPSSVDLRN